jgi:hypothetical protein
MKLYLVRGRAELSINEDEIKQYLESKKLKPISLPDDSNYNDQGSSTAKEQKIGQKNLARAEHLVLRDEKLKYGDQQAIEEYVKEASQIRQRLENERYQSRLEYDLDKEQKKRLAIKSKITSEDIENEVKDVEKLKRKRDNEINNIHDYFNSSNEFWEEWQKNGHEGYESPAGALITQADNGTWACDIHRYQNVLESPTNDGRLTASSYTIDKVENHFRKDPKPHLDALIEVTNNKYEIKINARKEETLQDKEVAFKKDIRRIEKIKTRPGGDYGLLNSGTKLTKGDKARIREAEESENEKNRKIYRGLY